MFSPKLTTASGIERVGLVKRKMERTFRAEDELIRSLEATSDAVAADLVRSGDLRVSGGRFFDETERGRSFCKARAAGGLLGWAQVVVPFYYLLGRHGAAWGDTLEELFLNAVYHGTDFCRTGLVSVGGILGSEGSLLYVDQSPSTVVASTLQARLERRLEEDFTVRASGREGGIGLWQAAGSNSLEVNFEDIEGIRAGMRALLFSPGVLSEEELNPS